MVGIRRTGARTFGWTFLGALALAGWPVAAEAQDGAAAWKAGKIFVPASLSASGKSCESDVGGACIADIKPGRHPVIVFLHGCGGPRKPASLVEQGAIVVAPNSFAGGAKCVADPVEIGKLITRRHGDVAYAAAQVKAAPWADPGRIVLAGFSNGGQTVAVYPGAEFKARVIVAWTCTNPRRPEMNGVKGSEPVLAVLGSNDEFYKKINIGGDCGSALSKRAGSSNVMIKGGGHEIIDHKETRDAATPFLAIVLK